MIQYLYCPAINLPEKKLPDLYELFHGLKSNLQNEAMFNVRLYNICQQLVAEQESCQNEVKLNTHNLQKGLYIMHIIDENGVVKEKLIVEQPPKFHN